MPTPRQNLELDRRDQFLYWWPVTSRLFGMALATWQTVIEKVDRPSLLALAGALLVAPNILKAQDKRNASRTDEAPETE